MPGIEEIATDSQKKTLRSSQAASERVQLLRSDYWERIKLIDPEDLVFLDEMGVLLGLTRTHARSLKGQRVYDLKPFYRGQKSDCDWCGEHQASFSRDDAR